MIGIGAKIHALCGGSPKSASDYYGRKVVSATLDDNVIRLGFEDGSGLKLWDDGQSCCESRYITCDDDLSSLVGGTLTKIEAKDGPDVPDEYGEHETCFIEIATTKGAITLTTHNEHNGYYGGFGLSVDDDERAAELEG